MPDRIQLILAVVVCLLSAGCATLKDPDPSDRSIAFVHVNLIPMDRERVVPDQTVIVRDGRIASIGPADAAEMREDLSLRIAGRGKYLMPGLSDMHAHIHPAFFEEQDLVVLVANGVTTVRNMWGTPVHLEWQNRVQAGDLLGPTIYTAGSILEGDPPVHRGTTIVTTAEDARRAVREQRDAGYDFIKIYHTLSKEAFDAIMAAGKEFAIQVVGHVPHSVTLRYAMEAGEESIEHLWGYTFALQASTSPYRTLADFNEWQDWFRTWNHIDVSKIPSLVRATKKAGVWNCPTLVATMSKNLPEETEQKLGLPETRYVNPRLREMWEQREIAEEIVRIGRRSHALRLEIVKALRDEGAGLLLGTDFPGSFVFPGFSIHQELQYFVDAGLTPYEAIKAGTHDAAEFLGAMDEFGVVAVGRRADLILVEGNPLEDVAHIKDRVGVMARGRWYTQDELQTRLDALADRYAETKPNGGSATSHGQDDR